MNLIMQGKGNARKFTSKRAIKANGFMRNNRQENEMTNFRCHGDLQKDSRKEKKRRL